MTDRPPSRWALWRQDDNGHRERMRTYEVRADAERALARLEALGHKQTYWIELAESDASGAEEHHA